MNTSLRLTRHLRESIRDALLVNRFQEEVGQLLEDKTKLAMDVYNDVYTQSERRRMKRLPKGWLWEADRIAVKLEGSGSTGITNLAFEPGAQCFSVLRRYAPKFTARARKRDRKMRMPFKDKCTAAKVYPPGHELCRRWAKLDHRGDKLQEQIGVARLQIMNALNRVTTTGKLVEVWPETKPFLEKLAPNPRAVPAVPVPQLNEMLKLGEAV